MTHTLKKTFALTLATLSILASFSFLTANASANWPDSFPQPVTCELDQYGNDTQSGGTDCPDTSIYEN